MNEPATTIEGFSEVEQCRTEEAARKRKQKQQSGFLGLFTGAIDAGCGMDFDPDKTSLLGVNSSNMSLLSQDLEEDQEEDQDSQDQTRRIQSNQSTQGEIIWQVGCAVASFVGTAAETIVDSAHAEENAAAQDCDRMLADLTLEKIDEMGRNMKQGFDEVKNKMNSMERKMDIQHQETVRMFDGINIQIRKGNRKMQELIQEEVMEEMQALGEDTALLSSKLDQALQKGMGINN